MTPEYVTVRRDALDALIEDVKTIARLCDSMAYARLMGRVQAVVPEPIPDPNVSEIVFDPTGLDER